MMRSLFSGVAGLKNHQTRMDVIGNNIANVNTTGYKAGRTTFQDMLSQTVQGAASPTGNIGGTNPMQIGLGMSVSSIDNIFTNGSFQNTGKNTDLAIGGEGFFILQQGLNQYYTKSGNFDFDTNGDYVVPGTGMKVAGWNADANGRIDTSGPLSTINVPIGMMMPPKASTTLTVQKNLSSESAAGFSKATNIDVYDSLGNKHDAVVTFTKVDAAALGDPGGLLADAVTAAETALAADPTNIALQQALADAQDAYNTALAPFENQWTVTVTMADAISGQISGTIQFTNEGKLLSTTNMSAVFDLGPSVDPLSLTLDVGQLPTSDVSKAMTQYGTDTTAVATDTDGYTAGSLDRSRISIDSTGIISGVFDNGQSMKLGQIALANFANPAGLTKVGSTLYAVSNNSGVAQIGTPGSGGLSGVTGSTLEMSNVDLSEEFTNMITTQRGFQANSRIITTSDSMLEELVNLKR